MEPAYTSTEKMSAHHQPSPACTTRSPNAAPSGNMPTPTETVSTKAAAKAEPCARVLPAASDDGVLTA